MFEGERPLLGVGVGAVPLGGAAEVGFAAGGAEARAEGTREDEFRQAVGPELIGEGAGVGDVDAADGVENAAEDCGGEDAVATANNGFIAEGAVGEAEAGSDVVVVGMAERFREADVFGEENGGVADGGEEGGGT